MIDRIEFRRHIEGLVELPAGTLNGAEKLEELQNWDSVTLVSFLALVDETYARRIALPSIGECRTVDDLASLVDKSPAA